MQCDFGDYKPINSFIINLSDDLQIQHINIIHAKFDENKFDDCSKKRKKKAEAYSPDEMMVSPW